MTHIGNATLDTLTLQVFRQEEGKYTVHLLNEFGKREERKENLTREEIMGFYEDFDFSEVRW